MRSTANVRNSLVRGHPRDQIHAALGERQAVRLDRVRLRAMALRREIPHLDDLAVANGFEQAARDVDQPAGFLRARGAVFVEMTCGSVERNSRMRGLSARSIFASAAPSSSASGQPESAVDDRSAEVQGGDVGHRQSFLHGAKRLRVEPPPLRLVFLAFVVDREAGFLERLQVAADRARRDLDGRRELVDRHAHAARLDLTQDLPLSDDFSVAHRRGRPRPASPRAWGLPDRAGRGPAARW